MAYTIKNYPYNQQLTAEENLLLDRLYRLKMTGMAITLEKQLTDPNAELEPFITRVSEIINAEWEQRQNTKFNKLKRQATLKYPDADLDESIYEPDRQLDTHTIELLAKCEWIDVPRNLLITGATGAGKTHIANALCIAALHQLRTVKYTRATPLINEGMASSASGEEVAFINKMSSYDLLVIDDFGLMDLSVKKCRLLFEILETRDSRKATMIVSQIPVSKWWDIFRNDTYADACLSRITSRAHRLEFNGRDMRQPV